MRIVATNILYPTPTKSHIVGGAEVTVKTIYEALAENGHEVTVIRGTSPDGQYQVEISSGVRVHTLPIRNAYWPFDKVERSTLQKLMWHARDDFGSVPVGYGDIIDKVQPDLCVFHNIGGITWKSLEAARSRGLPIIQVLHDYYYPCPRGTLFRNGQTCSSPCLDCRSLSMFRRGATKLVDTLNCVSQRVLDIVEADGLFPNATVKEVIHNPVYRFGTKAKRGGEGVIFGYLGRPSSEKGIFLLAEAYRKMPENCRLVFAGEFNEDLQKQIAHLAAREVDFLGFIDPEQFFGRIDVLVVPSLWDEPFGRVVLEGQAMQVPAICSNRGGLPEALGGPDNGWVFDPSSIDNLATIMEQIARQPSIIREKAEAGYHRSHSFSARSVASKYEALFERTIALNALKEVPVA